MGTHGDMSRYERMYREGHIWIERIGVDSFVLALPHRNGKAI